MIGRISGNAKPSKLEIKLNTLQECFVRINKIIYILEKCYNG